MSTMDEAASITNDLGSVDPDVAPREEPFVDSSPATAAAVAAATAPAVAGVEVVSAPNREGTRDALKRLLSAENLSKHTVWNNTMDVCPTLSVSRLRAAVCAVFPHAPVHHTLRSLLLFFSFFLGQSTTKLPLKHGPKTTYRFALGKPNRVKTALRQDASSGALRGPLRRGPLISPGGAGVAAKPGLVPASPKPPVHWLGPVY